MSDATWLPNLVGGVSIWKLGVDLNEPKFFDGRLLVPETEGSESLPVTVRWDLTNLVPLRDAQAQRPEDVATATREFQACLERVAKIFSTPNSGFDKYKEAFTVPSLDADGGANYFYSPERKKLFVINWGASPRSMGGKSEYVFGYEDWGKHWGDVAGAGVAGAAAVGAGAVAAKAVEAVATPPGDEKKDEEKKPDEKKKDEKKRPWWLWPLFALIAIALVLLALFLLHSCEEPKTPPNADAAADASSDALADALAADAEAGAAADASDDAAALADAEAGADAANVDGGDAGKDASEDGSTAMDDDDDDDDDDGPGGNVKITGGGGGGGGGGAGGGKVIVQTGPGGGAKTAVHRKHYHNDAVKWRVATGNDKVSRTEQRGRRFDVWLSPGKTFEGVRVEWQDKAGKWHTH